MNASLRWAIIFAAVLLIGQGLCTSVMAVGDGSAGQGESIMAAVRASRSVCDGYTVEEIRYGAAIMREYVAPTGVVFGIDWKGMIHPDVTQLLGSFAGTGPEEALRAPGPPKIDTEAEDVVIQKWGQPDDPHGRAYAPDLAPQGVKIDKMWLSWPAA